METLELISDWLQDFFDKPKFIRELKKKAPKLKTGVPSVVFSGTGEEWKQYLETLRSQRYDSNIQLSIHINSINKTVEFIPGNLFSREFASIFNQAFKTLIQAAEKKKFVSVILNKLIFSNPSNNVPVLQLQCSSILPGLSTREIKLDNDLRAREVNIVIKQDMLFKVINLYKQKNTNLDQEEKLGILWPLLNRMFYHLSYPNLPRDRFVDKIELTSLACLININILFDGKDDFGNLAPTKIGKMYIERLAKDKKISVEELMQTDSYLRLLKELSFMFNERLANAYTDLAKILVREYLDTRYLRPAIAEIMPEVSFNREAMLFEKKNNKVKTPSPEIGKYGIIDEEDLAAWKKVKKKFKELDYCIIRQLGIGDFGRVYEAINCANPKLPERVAIKVDRIYKSERKKAIQAADMTIKLSQNLANAPHLIRIYDAGILEGSKYTYHIIQLVDGETLDNLAGVTGDEHASLSRPDIPETSLQNLRMVSLKSIQTSKNNTEIWRKKHAGHTFTDPLNLRQLFDLVISLLLLVEEVHELGYVINDLKNGNIMISRTGQLKGIDLDSFTQIRTPEDKIHDFIFLSVSLLLFLSSNLKSEYKPRHFTEQLQTDPDSLKNLMLKGWRFDDVSKHAGVKLTNSDVIDAFCNIIFRSKGDDYIKNPYLFSEDIDQLIRYKRLIFEREIVLD